MTRTDATTTPAKGTKHDHGLTAADKVIADLVSKVAQHEARLLALEAPVVTPPVTPVGIVVAPGWSGPQTSGHYVMHAGTYRFGFTAAEVSTTVSLVPYGDGPVIIDGTGLDPHFVYLGPGADWYIGDLTIQGFAPSDSGVIGIGDDCRLTLYDVTMRFGSAPMTAGAAQNRHLVYFHGTGSGALYDCDFAGAPGAALQSYRGAPKVTVEGGRFESAYRGALIYSGTWSINGATLLGTGSGIDAEYKAGMLTLTSCAGGGTNGTVRTYIP